MEAWGLPRSPPCLSPLYPSFSPVTFTSRGLPGAPDCCSPLSPPPPLAGSGSGLRARRALPTSPAPWTAHPAARRPLHSTRDGSCSRSPPAVLFLSDCHPPALYPLSSLSRRTPLWCGPETLLPFSALGSVVICDCPLTRGTQTPWTCLSRRERSWPAKQEAEEALGSWTQWLPGCRARALGAGRLLPRRLPASLDSTRARLPRTRPLPDHPTSSPCTATATP